ncbi:muscle M-line assembly protein unc-89-like isoform X2 [Haliotis asinina]|uniref:muscle M-line assembly protein unc-89-like isoform X2 n=1 Tax=Haliotis asinina TaxID=109174 RepID=UPI0035326CEB
MPEPIMQNGADSVIDHLESVPRPPASSILVTEAEISVEAIKQSRQASSSVKAKNGTSSTAEAPGQDKLEESQSDEKDKVEATVAEVPKETVLEEEKASKEEALQPKGDNSDKDVLNLGNSNMSESALELNSDKGESQKKKPGRPKKIDLGEKGKRKIGRPRKHPVVESVTKDSVEEAEVEKVAATGEATPEVDVDLFTYVPGKTSDPIQLSTVSSIVSGSEGTASIDGETLENSIKSGEGNLLNGSKHVEVKKLLKNKILSPDRTRKRKASLDTNSQPKIKKPGSRPPAEDSSSSQKQQDMNDFLDATQKALSGQEANGVADDEEDRDISASTVMAKGPCIDSEDDDELLKSYLKPKGPAKPWSVKKKKRKLNMLMSSKKKSPRSPENLKRLAEMATMHNSFEALNTSFVGEPEENDGAASPIVDRDSLGGETDSSAKSSNTKNIKKNAFAVLREQLSQEPRLNDAVLDIHNGDMIPPIPDSAEEFQSPKRRSKKFKAEPIMDAMEMTAGRQVEAGKAKQESTVSKPETTDVKKVNKGNSPRSKFRKKRFHKWNKKKKHSPAVLQRLEAQLKAMRAAIEAEKNAASHGFLPEPSVVHAGLMNIKKYGKTVLSQIKSSKHYSGKDGADDVGELLFSTSALGSLHPAPQRLQVAKRGRGRGGRMGRGGGLTTKKSSPIVRLSPLGPKSDTATTNESVSDIFNDAEMASDLSRDKDPPVLTKMSGLEPDQSSMKLPKQSSNQWDAPDGSDLQPKMQAKKSFLKPRDATEFASDTGAVSLKNILPVSRRMTAPKKNAFVVKRSYKRSLQNCGMNRGGKKGCGRGGGRGIALRRMMMRPGMATSKSKIGNVDLRDLSPDHSQGTPLHQSPHSQTSIWESDPVYQGGFYGKNVHRRAEGRRNSKERLSGMDQSSPSHDSRHSSGQDFRKGRSPGSFRRSMSEDNDQASGSEQNSNKSFSYSPNRKSGIGSTVGAVISQLFGDEIPRLVPGSGYVINVRLDVERKEATGTHKSHKNVSTQEDLDFDRRQHHSTSKEKSTHVSSTVNSYTRKPSHSEPQPSTSASPDDPYQRERTSQHPQISDVDLCAMLEERISSRRGLRVDVRDNLLDNIKHVERVLKESS